MPEKSSSVQVDAEAHGKVLRLSKVMGLTQLAAASLLIRVADEQVALDRHHRDAQTQLGSAAQPAAGGRDQEGTGGRDEPG